MEKLRWFGRFVIAMFVGMAITACEPIDSTDNRLPDDTTQNPEETPIPVPKPEPEPEPEPEITENPDSLAFMSLPRTRFEVEDAECYTISGEVFDAPQTISVITFSPKDFSVGVVLSEEVATVSETAQANKSDFAINASYWNVSSGKPYTFFKIDGEVLCGTLNSGYPRINGLIYFHYESIDIAQSYDYPYYEGLVEEYNNVIACGPVLLDNGEIVSYSYITESDDTTLQKASAFYINRHPRSVIGHDHKGNIYLVVVDGRAEGYASGMTIAELAQMCRWLGMSEAMNLDGGGSSTLWSSDQGVINHPCDNKIFDHEGERKVLSAIVVNRKLPL